MVLRPGDGAGDENDMTPETETTTEPLDLKLLTEDETSTHRHAANEVNSHSVYLYLDTRRREASYHIQHPANRNMIPSPIWHSIDHQWVVPSLPRAEANELLEDLEPILRRIADGTGTRWDGSNHVGQITDDAEAAIEELETELAARESALLDARSRIMTAENYFAALSDSELAEILEITAETSEISLGKLAAVEVEAALSDYVLDAGDVVTYLLDLRDRLRQEA